MRHGLQVPPGHRAVSCCEPLQPAWRPTQPGAPHADGRVRRRHHSGPAPSRCCRRNPHACRDNGLLLRIFPVRTTQRNIGKTARDALSRGIGRSPHRNRMQNEATDGYEPQTDGQNARRAPAPIRPPRPIRVRNLRAFSMLLPGHRPCRGSDARMAWMTDGATGFALRSASPAPGMNESGLRTGRIGALCGTDSSGRFG